MRSIGRSAGTGPEAAGERTGGRLARPPVGIVVLVGLELLLGLLYLVGPLLPGSLSQAAFWNLNAERSVGTWYSTTQLALLGVLLLAYAFARRRAARWPAAGFGVAGVLALLLSLDEQARLHERFARWVDSLPVGGSLGLDRSGPWMLIVAPVLLVVLMLIALAVRDDLGRRHQVVFLLVGGGLLFVVAFAGMEVVRNFVDAATTADRLLALAEELGEMLGITLVIWAVYELMRSHGLRLLSDGTGPATR